MLKKVMFATALAIASLVSFASGTVSPSLSVPSEAAQPQQPDQFYCNPAWCPTYGLCCGDGTGGP